MSENDNRSQMHKSQWRLRQVTDELNARPFPRFALPTAIFRLCLSGEEAFDGLRDALRDTLSDIDWDADAQRRLIRARQNGVQFNIERHTEFVSLTIIDEKAENGSAAQHLPPDWLDKNRGEVVVAVDCQCSIRGTARDGWTCASRLENGLADGFFDFKVAEDGHTKIALDFAPDCDVRDVGRIALQVVEIETYRSFAAIGLNRARAAQAQLSDVAARVPTSISAAGSADSERFDLLSQLTGELEEIWRRTSFRFAACTAYWDLVTARLASLQEQAFDSRITIGGFLERRLQPAIATYQSTERRRHDLAEQIAAMTGLLQTRIELICSSKMPICWPRSTMRPSGNCACSTRWRGFDRRHFLLSGQSIALTGRLGVWLKQPALDPLIVNLALVAITVPLVWLSIRRLLRATVGGKKSD